MARAKDNGGRFIRREWDVNRFMSNVSEEPNTGCWIWLGACDPSGYGRAWVDGRDFPSHRLSLRLFMQTETKGNDQVDHLCRSTWCVNPEHLEYVSCLENNRRKAAAKMACVNGHRFEGSSYVIYKGRRICIPCRREAGRRYDSRRNR